MDAHDPGRCFLQLKPMGGGVVVVGGGCCYGFGGRLHVSVISTVQLSLEVLIKVAACFKSNAVALLMHFLLTGSWPGPSPCL